MRRLAVALLLLAASGCGTLEATLVDGDATPYGGVAKDVQLATRKGVWFPVAIFDLPLSAVGDTLLLPITLPLHLTRK